MNDLSAIQTNRPSPNSTRAYLAHVWEFLINRLQENAITGKIFERILGKLRFNPYFLSAFRHDYPHGPVKEQLLGLLWNILILSLKIDKTSPNVFYSVNTWMNPMNAVWMNACKCANFNRHRPNRTVWCWVFLTLMDWKLFGMKNFNRKLAIIGNNQWKIIFLLMTLTILLLYKYVE